MSGRLVPASENVVQLSQLRDTLSGDPDDGATCLCTLLDANGSEVTGQTWPVVMQPQGGGTGNYVATIDAEANLRNGDTYTTVVNVVGSGGERRRFTCDLLALEDDC